MLITDQQKINQVKVISEESDESIVAFYLNNAKEIILHQLYPFMEDISFTEMPSKYDFLQCRIACALISKRGGEGELHHSENGILRIYETADVPESMIREIVPKAVVM